MHMTRPNMIDMDSPPDPGQQRDLAPLRRERVRQIVGSRGIVRIEDLRGELGVSLATVRRDLDELESAGKLRRVHGGAMAVDERVSEPLFDAKAAEAASEKQRIAECALGLLKRDDTIFLDSGSTVLALARLLHGWDRLTVVTNSLPAAVELTGRGPRLIVIGGELRATSQAIVGPLTKLLLDELFIDRAFMGTYALSLDDGMSTTDPAEAFSKNLVVQRAREVILLADSRKVGRHSFVRAGTLDQVDVLITDEGIEDRAVRLMERRGIRVLKA